MKSKRTRLQRSRLYRQATKGSAILLADLTKDNVFFTKEIPSLSDSGAITISSEADGARWVKAAGRFATQKCKEVSADLGVPILLQSIMDHYYGANKIEARLLGRYLKRTLEFVSGNNFCAASSQSRSHSSVKKAVRATALLDQLEAYYFLFAEFAEEGDHVTVETGLITASNHFSFILDKFRRPNPPHKRFMRTLSSTSTGIWRNPSGALEAIERILRGESPRDQKVFDRTLLVNLSSNEPPEFWAGLWARLILATLSNSIRSQVTSNVNTISVFEPFKISAPGGVDTDLIQQSIHQLFWDRDWYLRRVNKQPGGLITERPAVRVSNHPKLYATTPLLVGDSLNWFIETSIVPYPNAGVPRLSDKVFKDLISRPFEDSVTELFRSHGFSAGRVSDVAVWETQSQQIRLFSSEVRQMPGEIDVLAYHEESRAVVIIECKVMTAPLHSNRMRNISRTLGDLDQEGFHSKLEAKISWLKKTDYFKDLVESSFIGFLVLDVKLGWMTQAKYPVVDFDDLRQFMSEADPFERIINAK